MTIEWQYIDETTWTLYDVGGIANPRTSFVIRITDGDGKVRTRFVSVCGDTYEPFIRIAVTDSELTRKYEATIEGMPEAEIDEIAWTVTHDDVPFVYEGGEIDATGVDVVCVSAIVTIVCGCDDIEIPVTCYSFGGEQIVCPDEIGLDLVLEDGCWKPVRTGDIECCVALDLILYRLDESHDWSILRDPYETICGNIVYFKRVVSFIGSLCETIIFETNSDNSDVS